MTTTAEAGDAVAELLTICFAQTATSYTDAETGTTTVAVYSQTRPSSLRERLAQLRQGIQRIKLCDLDVGAGKATVRVLTPQNWAESWKRHFQPLEIGDALLIKPSWSKRRTRKGQAVVVLDPGLSFGTGQHPTTEFCLRQIVRSQKLPPSLLDIGTGSGILAIAAAKLGYAPVHAFDFDPQSVSVARANARANRVQNKIRITRADLTKLPRRSAWRYDVVCANLLANLLIAERDRILERLKLNGRLVVAGILKREFNEVVAAYQAAGMKLIASKAQKEWRSGTFVRHTLLNGVFAS